MKIRINSVNEALKFARIAEGFDEDIDITDGRYIINGKSQMGILMICANNTPLDVTIDTDDTVTCATFRNAIEEFLVLGE